MTVEEAIVESVRSTVGSVPVLLGGSRAVGCAGERSDWDVVVVLPWPHALLALRPLARAARRLETQVGATISLNPLPAGLLRREPPRLFVWKLRREGVVLSAPPGFSLGEAGPFLLDDEAEFSYATAGAIYLLAGATEKAARHLVQLRQLRVGAYEPAAAAPGGDLATELARELAAAPAPGAHAVVRNLQYALLSTLRGRPRLRAALSRGRVDARLAEAARLLLEGDIAAAAGRLPRALRPRSVTAASVTETIVREWPHAHPLLGL